MPAPARTSGSRASRWPVSTATTGATPAAARVRSTRARDDVPIGVVTSGTPARSPTASPAGIASLPGGRTTSTSWTSISSVISPGPDTGSSARPNSLRPSASLWTTSAAPSGSARWTTTFGWATRNAPISRATGSTASVGSATRSSRPAVSPRISATEAATVAMSRRTWRAGPRSASPAALSTRRRPTRWNSSTPTSRSRLWIVWDNDGWATCSSSAARVTPW